MHLKKLMSFIQVLRKENIILSQMNSNRLSTKLRSSPVVDRALLQIEIDKLLMGHQI